MIRAQHAHRPPSGRRIEPENMKNSEDFTSKPTVKDFPAGLPAPHLARDWARSVESVLTDRGLTDVAREEIPSGLFPKLWSVQALEPPPELPSKASFGDTLRWRSMRDEVEKRIAHNEQVVEQRREWWLKRNHEYFIQHRDAVDARSRWSGRSRRFVKRSLTATRCRTRRATSTTSASRRSTIWKSYLLLRILNSLFYRTLINFGRRSFCRYALE